MNVIIRPEQPSDYQGIKEVNDRAFQQPNEGQMVDAIRSNPKYVPELSLVALVNDKIVGHILFFPILIKGDNEIFATLSLAPLAVLPEFQNKGIGGKLTEYGLIMARQQGYTSVLVMGHPTYYPRFGFEKASKWKIFPPIEAPDEASMAIELFDNALDNVSGIIEYPEEYKVAM